MLKIKAFARGKLTQYEAHRLEPALCCIKTQTLLNRNHSTIRYSIRCSDKPKLTCFVGQFPITMATVMMVQPSLNSVLIGTIPIPRTQTARKRNIKEAVNVQWRKFFLSLQLYINARPCPHLLPNVILYRSIDVESLDFRKTSVKYL